MKKEKPETTSTRVDLSAETMRRIDRLRKKQTPIPKLKPFVESLIEQALNAPQKPQPEGER